MLVPNPLASIPDVLARLLPGATVADVQVAIDDLRLWLLARQDQLQVDAAAARFTMALTHPWLGPGTRFRDEAWAFVAKSVNLQPS
ncbi:MAG TPA: hypothetical protein VGR44_12070 [Methylomirabilota bacterium]|jgi:hypothetical protein|nr:hypothetical protein [Methylomirabilota bacterium]